MRGTFLAIPALLICQNNGRQDGELLDRKSWVCWVGDGAVAVITTGYRCCGTLV